MTGISGVGSDPGSRKVLRERRNEGTHLRVLWHNLGPNARLNERCRTDRSDRRDDDVIVQRVDKCLREAECRGDLAQVFPLNLTREDDRIELALHKRAYQILERRSIVWQSPLVYT